MDEIQQKLARIDAQLTGRNLRDRLVSTAPLFFPAVGLMTGILVQDRLLQRWAGANSRIVIWMWLVLLTLCAAGAGVYLARHRQGLRPPAFAYRALLCFLCLGAVRLWAFETADPRDIRHFVGVEPVLATIRGRILTEPQEQLAQSRFAQLAYADPSTAFYLRIDQVEGPTSWQEVSGTVRVQVDEPAPNVRLGDYIQAYCRLHRFEDPGNPGQFNLAAYLGRRNVYVGASVPLREAITVRRAGGTSILATLRSTFSAAAARGLLDQAPSDTQGEAMLEALLLGERRNIDPETYEAFRRTGSLHFISLSGLHVGILIGMVWWLCKLAGLLKPARAFVCIVATAVFLLIVPPRAPTLRAAVIVWAYCLSILLHRRANSLNSVSLAAIILLLLRPTQLFEAGWQLSFSAVAGILALTARIEHFILDRTGNWFRELHRQRGPFPHLVWGAGQGAIRLFAAGLAAWLGSVGILLYHFYAITPLASIWTVLVFLPVALILTLGFLKILLFFLLPTISMLLGVMLSGLTGLLIAIVKLIGEVDFSSVLLGHVPVILIVLYYALVVVSASAHLPRPALKKGLCAAMALALFVSLGLLKWQRTHRDDLRLTCLNVGHGQAILAQLPGTKNVLFDAGSLHNSAVGARVVRPFLNYIGTSHLHAVVVSHHDVDHINGIPEVVDGCRVDRVYADDVFFGQSQSAETAALLLEHLERAHVRAERLPSLLQASPAEIRVLWPADNASARQDLSNNDRSLVCLITYAGRKILLCSDIETFAQRQILRLYPTLKADVVVVPHHGSQRTLHEDFLERLGADVLICSCAPRDIEQGRVVVQGGHAALFHTAKDGAVTVCINSDGVVEVRGFKAQEGD